jgi:adenylate cyclase
MIGWARRHFRAKVFLALSALILALLLATLWLTQLAVSRQVQGTLQAELLVTGQVFKRLVAERAQRLLMSSTLLAGDFALKRALATYDPPTLGSVAVNYQQRLGVDALWITDERGTLLADSRVAPTAGAPLADVPPVSEAVRGGQSTAAVAAVDGALFQLVTVPVLAPDVIGHLVVGAAIDDAVARQLERDTGSQVSFVSGAQVFASSWAANDRPAIVRAVRGARPATESFLVRRGRERFLSLGVPIESRLAEPLAALVQRSYDEALRPLTTLRLRIAGIGLGALAVALLVGAALAGGVTSPVRTLVAATEEVMRGNLRHRLRIDRVDEVGVLARSFNAMVRGLEEREVIRDTFGRFVSRDVAEAVLNDRVPLGGERREVSILFQDIRGFTTLSERMDPSDMVRLLNRFFTEIVAAVEAEGGVVKQFVGDGVMALFGAPSVHPDHAERAVRAALGMLARLARLNAEFRAEGRAPLAIGVGIHTGEVVAGRIGPDKRVEYAAVGDPVNLASRIEGLTKEMNAAIVVSRETAAQLGPGFHFGRSATFRVKGKEKPVEVVEVLAGDG